MLTREARRRRRRQVIFLVLVALIIVTLVLVNPVLRYIKSSEELREKEMELKREKEKTAQLEERKAQASDLDFLEREARRLGFVKPGEIPVKVVEENLSESGGGEENPSRTP